MGVPGAHRFRQTRRPSRPDQRFIGPLVLSIWRVQRGGHPRINVRATYKNTSVLTVAVKTTEANRSRRPSTGMSPVIIEVVAPVMATIAGIPEPEVVEDRRAALLATGCSREQCNRRPTTRQRRTRPTTFPEQSAASRCLGVFLCDPIVLMFYSLAQVLCSPDHGLWSFCCDRAEGPERRVPFGALQGCTRCIHYLVIGGHVEGQGWHLDEARGASAVSDERRLPPGDLERDPLLGFPGSFTRFSSRYCCPTAGP